MTRYIQDPKGVNVKRIPPRGWVRFPDGTSVASPEVGFTSEGGYVVVEVEDTPPPEVAPATNERVRNKPAPAYRMLEVLYHRGFLDVVRKKAKVLGGMTEVFFDRAPYWSREGEHEQALLGTLRMGGDELTEEEIDDIFLEALEG